MDPSPPATGAQRWVPLGYIALAHLGLGAACAVTLWDSSQVSGFFYHPKMVAVVHTLTLGWISSTLIGILYMAAPRLGLRASRFDVWVLAAWILGASGLVSHNWIETFGGMTWSAGLTGIAALLAAGRFFAATATVPLAAHVRLQFSLAWLNVLVAAFVGVLLGFNKTTPVLPGYSLHNVFAHAHLAAIGWAFLLSIAVGHVYAAETATPRAVPPLSIAGTILTQSGAVGLFVTLLLGGAHALPFGLAAVAGMALCCAALAWQFFARRPASVRPAHLLLAAAVVWLGIAASIVLRAYGSPDGTPPKMIMAYGVAALLGGLGQGVAGLGMLWIHRAFPIPTGRHAEWPAVVGWWIAAPLLMLGLGANRSGWILGGGGALLFAVVWTARSIVLAARAARATRDRPAC